MRRIFLDVGGGSEVMCREVDRARGGVDRVGVDTGTLRDVGVPFLRRGSGRLARVRAFYQHHASALRTAQDLPDRSPIANLQASLTRRAVNHKGIHGGSLAVEERLRNGIGFFGSGGSCGH